MGNNLKKAYAVGMAAVMGISMILTGCGSDKSKKSEEAVQESSKGKTDEVEKPEKIKILVNGNVFTKENGRDQFEKRWEELTGIDLEITQPDHDAYNDVMGQVFASGPDNWPDVVLLSSQYYTGYAKEGALWDMTNVWENSELKKSGRYNNEDVLDQLKIDGKLYGFAHEKGKGCITYVKKAWLDNCKLDVPTTFEEYTNMLEAFTTGDPDGNGVDGDTYGVTAAGLVAPESPWVMYLPEFYQDATIDFVKNEDGKWEDGFLKDNMKETLQRLKDAYDAGYLEKEVLTNGTSDCRNKFFEDKFGAFTYWSGSWGTSLSDTLGANGYDSELVALPPIKELGNYVAKLPNVMAITSACKNPEGVFKYFIESILDGGDMQTLWTYGVEDVHWSRKSETVLGHEYPEGEFHFEESLEKPGVQYGKAYIDPLLTAADWVDGDPGDDALDSFTKESQEIFDENSKQLSLIPSTDEMAESNGDLMTLKKRVVAEVVSQGLSVDEGYKLFQDEGGVEMSDKIVKSMNE